MFRKSALILLICSSITLSASAAIEPINRLKMFIIRALPFISDHFFIVEKEHCYRSKQLTPKKLRQYLKKHKIKTVVNLRAGYEHLKNAEHTLCKKMNVEFHYVPFFPRELPKPEVIKSLLHIFEHAPRPLLFHCRAGVDRTGLACALWQYEIRQRPINEVLEQLSFTRYGHFESLFPSMKKFLRIWDNLRRVNKLSCEQALVAYAALPEFASSNSTASSMSSSNSISSSTSIMC